MATINVDETENLEKAIKRFKRMVEKEGIIREFKRREYFEKPSALLHQKKKITSFWGLHFLVRLFL